MYICIVASSYMYVLYVLSTAMLNVLFNSINPDKSNHVRTLVKLLLSFNAAMMFPLTFLTLASLNTYHI